MTRPTATGGAASSAAPAAAVRYTSTLDCARTLFRTGGLAAFGQGLSATIARNVVGVSAYFWAYEAVRRRLAGSERSVESLGPAETLLAGGCGGVAYWVLAYPGDIVKSAMQTDAIEPAARKYRSVGQTAALLWAEGGARRFTAGIVPGNVRQETAERVELDMACSALNRHVMLKEMMPRLKASARVLIWGFPGSGGGDYLKEASVQDFNSTAKFHGGFGQAHMNTVALNEALVLHWAAKGATTVGFNPGLVVTDIRKPLHGGGADSCVESCIIPCCAGGLKTGPYVQKVLYTLTTPDLEANKGVMIHQDGTPIKQSPQMTPEVVAQWIAAADGLAASALATSGASK